MFRLLSTVACAILLMLAASAPLRAQFGSIFAPPRPPADVPEQRPQPRNFPSSRDLPPAEPLPAPMNLPPSQRPGAGSIEAQPLAPPRGSANAPSSAPTAPLRGTTQESSQPSQQAIPGLPPAQRQPRGAPPPQQPASVEPPQQSTDEVVVEPPEQKLVNPTAVFSGLDKITGRTISFDVAINETVQFGALQVTPHVCYSRPPTETPRTDAFVTVDEVTLQGEVKRIFNGWMFASSPGLHAVEHPIYDVWLTDCKGAAQPEVTAEAPAENKPAAQKPKPPANNPPRRRSSTQSPFLSPFR